MKNSINDIRKKGRLMMLSCCTILGLLLASCEAVCSVYAKSTAVAPAGSSTMAACGVST